MSRSAIHVRHEGIEGGSMPPPPRMSPEVCHCIEDNGFCSRERGIWIKLSRHGFAKIGALKDMALPMLIPMDEVVEVCIRNGETLTLTPRTESPVKKQIGDIKTSMTSPRDLMMWGIASIPNFRENTARLYHRVQLKDVDPPGYVPSL